MSILVVRESISNTYMDEDGADSRYPAFWSVEGDGIYFWGIMDDFGELIQEGFY